MKRRKKLIIPAAVLAGTAVAGGLHVVNINQVLHQPHSVMAYTSAENTQDPATAPDSYVVNIPDINLKAALNDIIAKAMNAERKRQGLPEDVVRTPDQTITAKDMKVPANMYGPLGLDSKNITNIEGLQFLVNATYLSITVNNITDVAPLRDLPKLQRLEISRNKLNNDGLQVFAAMPTLTNLNIARNPDLTDISAITNRKDWRALNLGGLKFEDLTALSGMNQLQFLSLDAMNTRNKLDLTPIAALPEIISLNLGHQTVGLDEDDVAVVGNLPKLTTLNITGNKIVSLDHLFQGGFDKLVGNNQSNIVADQKHFVIDLPKGQREFHNPLTGLDGGPISVIETANVKNENGGNKVKLVGLGNKGSVRVQWNTTFSRGNLTDVKFSGYMTVNYDLSDNVKPVFSPEQPAKIISRKGVAINLLDVTASDADSGLSDAGVTYNNGAIGLNPDNPAKGKYTLTYTAEDKSGNRATVDREIEITDADSLQAKVAGVTDASLEGYTADSVQAVKAKKAAAEAIVAKNDATQEQIDQSLTELNDAIGALKVDVRKLVAAVTNRYNAEPDYIQQDPAVQTALAEANRVLNDPAKTPASVDKAARDLIKALEDAKQAEADRQAQAEQAVIKAETDKNSADFADAQSKIDAVKDPAKKAALQDRLNKVKQDFEAKKQALKAKIDQAKDPATTAGMKQDGVNNLKAQVALAEALYAQIDTNAKQADVEAMTAKLDELIGKLEIDTAAIDMVLADLATKPDYIKTDPAVEAAKAEAERVKALPGATPQQIVKAAQDLVKAMTDAQKAETDRQQAAEELVDQAETDKTVYIFDQAQAKINEVKDPTVKAQLNTRLQAAQQAYDNAKSTLQNAILTAENPATTDGMSKESVDRLKQALAEAKKAMAEKTPQQAIEAARNALNQAISQLEVDKTVLDQAIAEHDAQPDYIKNDSAVLAAKAEADRIKALPTANKDQVKQAAEDLKNAIKAAQQSELDKQKAAEQEIAKAEADLSPVSIAAAQGKIDTVQDLAKKAELQTKLDALKKKLDDQKQALRDLITKAQDPVTVDGMTDATKNALLAKIADAILVRDAAGMSSEQILTATKELQQAIDDLRADKTSLEAALATAEAEPAYLKGKSGFRRALDGARATRGNPNPTVAEVRAAIKALQDAKPEAVLQETQAQQAMAEALEAAQKEIDKFPSLTDNQLFNIDLGMLERLIGQVDEPVKKAELQAKLDAIKAAYNKRKAEVDAKKPKSPNAGYQKQANIGLLTSVISLPLAVIALAVKKLKRQ